MTDRRGVAAHHTNHRRGKLVVLAIFALGVTLGLVGYAFRNTGAGKQPMTRPTTGVSTES